MRNSKYTRYTYKKKYLDMRYDLEEFDPNKEYTASDLEAYTDLYLWNDKDAKSREEWNDGPAVLFQEHIENRWNREVLNKHGIPDDEITKAQSNDGQTMYYRTHPEGRKVNSAKQREVNGASYFR